MRQTFAVIILFLTMQSCQSHISPRGSPRQPAIGQPSSPPPKPVPPPSISACDKAQSDICAIEVAIFRQTNAYRRQSGQREFVLGRKISFAARRWSQIQGERNRIGHGGFSRDRKNTIQNEYGSDSGIGMSAENVAMIFSRKNPSDTAAKAADRVAESFVKMWISSRGHRRNLLSSKRVIGVGVYKTSAGKYFATQIMGSEDDDTTVKEGLISADNTLVLE